MPLLSDRHRFQFSKNRQAPATVTENNPKIHLLESHELITMDNYEDGAIQQIALPPFISLIKPQDLISLSYFSEASRAKYTAGITTLWDQINSAMPDSDSFNIAVMKLHEVTLMIKEKIQEHEAKQRSLISVATARREKAQQVNIEHHTDEEIDVAFKLMVETIAKSCVSTTVDAQRFAEEAGHLAYNGAGLLEFVSPEMSTTPQGIAVDNNASRTNSESKIITEVRDNVQATLGFLADNALTGEDVEAALILLDMNVTKNEAATSPESLPTVSTDNLKKKPTKLRSLIDLENIIPRPNQGRALRDRRPTDPMAYKANYHPADEVLKPKHAARVKSQEKK
ncbi:hypothetical protein P7C71_g3918, partial [Lecanoromycetidae sp. Uapishka_2]